MQVHLLVVLKIVTDTTNNNIEAKVGVVLDGREPRTIAWLDTR